MPQTERVSSIPLTNGKTATVKSFLGEGGQGSVYLVEVDDKPYALKWYKPEMVRDAAAFRRNLQDNINAGSPSPRFLWPVMLTEEAAGSFGYVMPLRPPEYADFGEVLLNRVQLLADMQIRAALNIVDAFSELHLRGFSYQDLNDGGFFVDPNTGDVLICDCDNVCPDGANITGIAGKPGYMAPEIEMGVAPPSRHSDYHSLAVALFRLFMRHNPLLGERYVKLFPITAQDEHALFGSDPVFVFDPQNDTNRPRPGRQDAPLALWPLMPAYIQERFIQVFTQGLKQPNTRPSEQVWRRQLLRYQSELITCPRCGRYKEAVSVFPRGREAGRVRCMSCGSEYRPPVYLDVNGYQIMMTPGRQILKCQVEHSDDMRTVVAEVVKNPNDPRQWGLRNLTSSPWYLMDTSGQMMPFPAGKSVLYQEGMRVRFGSFDGVFKR